MGSFSEDANLTAEMLEAFMNGAQGELVGPQKILVHLKHWPGAGPHKDGTGQWLTYSGNNFDYHLIPWKKGIQNGALAAMGYYSGTYYDTLNVNFSYHISTEVLYDQLNFKGAICTDWTVVSRGPLHPALQGKTSLKENMGMVINAGVDQMGAETSNQLVIELVKEDKISEERINTAAGRILLWHFNLGLFEDPYVDPDAAVEILQSEKNQALGYQAQLESIILLSNQGILPANEKIKIYTEGIDKEIAAAYASLVDDPAEADLILVRTFTQEDRGFMGFGGGGDGEEKDEPTMEEIQLMMANLDPMAPREINIDFPIKKWDHIKKLTSTDVPVVVAFNPSGSSCVLPADLKEVTQASLMVFDALDNALLDVIFGKFNPKGKLPFEIPSSMEAVTRQLEDVPFDSENPTFEFGYGLSY
jgi:beta-glucosidase